MDSKHIQSLIRAAQKDQETCAVVQFQPREKAQLIIAIFREDWERYSFNQVYWTEWRFQE